MTEPMTPEVRRNIEDLMALAEKGNNLSHARVERSIRNCLAEIDRLRAPVWIRITEGPDETKAPWDGKPVLICTDHRPEYGSRVHRAIWTDAVHGHGIHGWAVEDCKFGPYALRGYMNVTHWMPLPEPPEIDHA